MELLRNEEMMAVYTDVGVAEPLWSASHGTS